MTREEALRLADKQLRARQAEARPDDPLTAILNEPNPLVSFFVFEGFRERLADKIMEGEK